MKADLGLHTMKRISSAIPALILPFTGNSLPFSFSKLPISCFLSCYSSASDENVNMGMSEPTHLETLVIALTKMTHYALVVSMCKQMMGCIEFRGDVFLMTIWIRCLCNLKRVDLGFSVFAIIIKLGLQPNPYTTNALLLGLIDEGKINEAMGLFWKILKNGYPYDQYTYGVIIRKLCNSGNIHFAVVLLIKMNVNGSFEPDVICYNTIIDGFCKEKRMDKALIIFQDMLDKRIEPNVVTFSSLVNGFCSAGLWDEAKRLLAAMVNMGISPNVYTLNAFIAPLCKDGKIQEAISLFDLMILKRIEPDVATYNMLIHALCKFGEWKLATNFFENMIASKISPDVARNLKSSPIIL
ncbi:hypothetical protein F3Y22_tig00116944pilonHSYRG00173 [Hibiscus syriacus]|uniref:Pentatricopeptide repeat-containing protein n=1 Tax=Hibiscus syriacus TaxID=106335 RepID=A0A6A2X1L8_HIBSY|nr:hypothetical protein F3Y22_tig00116944pilonHSYRG00173 [Hibiscus syriacus]